jgi:hypothetical protein
VPDDRHVSEIVTDRALADVADATFFPVADMNQHVL